VAIFALVYALDPLQATYNRSLNAYMLTSIYGGWVFINRYFPRFLLILSIKAWLLYFAIKVIMAGMIGFFVTPIVVVYNIVQIIRERMK
jgi:hypothetical protein